MGAGLFCAMTLRHSHNAKQAVAFAHDTTMAALSFLVALGLRLGGDAWGHVSEKLLPVWGLFTLTCALVFLMTGLYRGLWRYASMNDLGAIIKAVSLAMLVFLPATFLLTRLDAVPRSSYVINWFVLIFLLGGPRMLYRIFKDHGIGHLLERDAHLSVPVLLVGAADEAEVFIREMARDRGAPYEVMALIDEKGSRVGRQIHGVPVVGSIEDLAADYNGLALRGGRVPQRLVVTRRLPRESMELLLEIAEAQGCSIAQMPRLADLSGGDRKSLDIRPVAIDDLLGRPQTLLDRPAMARLIEGRRVLVTGAGGSIGSELCRQIAALGPARLGLLDLSESLLYEIDHEIRSAHPALDCDTLLADVRSASLMDRIFAELRPELVFHAAALKHVPMVEANPLEGLLSNVIGTRNVAEACRGHGVSAMVLVSTDKAVNPPNVMGATKRLAEAYCQALDIQERARGQDQPRTRFITVRFGNVLGSTGSVVPLFQRQLSAGGPLTVTDPEMTRYFMTVREAVELILQASALGQSAPASEAGKIYLLEMGEPVKILDLARQMIRLAGLRLEQDIEIVFTGRRPGEKLHEELFHGDEPLVATEHPGLKLAAPRTANEELLARGLDDLERLARTGEVEAALDLLQRLVPEYQPQQRQPSPAAAAAS